MSEPTARRYTERAGLVLEALAVPVPEAAERRSEDRRPESAASPPPADPRPFWVGVDGMFVRLVGGAYREVRTVSIGRVNPPPPEGDVERVTTTDLSYFSRLTDSAEAFIDRAAVEVTYRDVAAAERVGAGADGADWCQRFFDRHCPQARRYLDFYHAGERIHDFSKALWPEAPALQKWYAEAQLHRLKHDGPEHLLASLASWSYAGGAEGLRAAASAQHAFFSTRTELLDYPGLRAEGLPIGTGNAESANLHVIQARLKGPGKFWGLDHVNPMLALRNAWCSQRWDEAWKATSEHLSAGHYPIRLVHSPKAKT